MYTTLDKRWVPRIRVNGKFKALGAFRSPEEARRAFENVRLSNNE